MFNWQKHFYFRILQLSHIPHIPQGWPDGLSLTTVGFARKLLKSSRQFLCPKAISPLISFERPGV
jgi:hypothetical protein